MDSAIKQTWVQIPALSLTTVSPNLPKPQFSNVQNGSTNNIRLFIR